MLSSPSYGTFFAYLRTKAVVSPRSPRTSECDNGAEDANTWQKWALMCKSQNCFRSNAFDGMQTHKRLLHLTDKWKVWCIYATYHCFQKKVDTGNSGELPLSRMARANLILEAIVQTAVSCFQAIYFFYKSLPR